MVKASREQFYAAFGNEKEMSWLIKIIMSIHVLKQKTNKQIVAEKNRQNIRKKNNCTKDCIIYTDILNIPAIHNSSNAVLCNSAAKTHTL